MTHVSDRRRSNIFYRDVLGAALVGDPEGVAMYRFGEQQLNLHGPTRGPDPVARLPVQPGGSDLCFVWPGPIEDAINHLSAHSVRIELGPVQRQGSGGEGRSVYFRDAHGGLLELISYERSALAGQISFVKSAEVSLPLSQRFVGYTGLCPRVVQSGERDRRGPISKHGPAYLRLALIEVTMHALRHPAYAERYQRTEKRLGKQRAAKVAQVELGRRLAHAIWHMLTRNQQFAPRGATFRLAARPPSLDMRPDTHIAQETDPTTDLT